MQKNHCEFHRWDKIAKLNYPLGKRENVKLKCTKIPTFQNCEINMQQE